MRKLICVVLLLSLLLCSCGTDSDANTNKGSAASSKPTSSVSSKTESKVESKEPIIPAVNDYSERTYNVVDILDYLKLDGRYRQKKDEFGKDVITYDNAYNCISFVADCEGDITLAIDLKLFGAEAEGYRERYFTVYIDGVRQEERYSISSNAAMIYSPCTLTVAKGLSKGKHAIEIYRQNESNLCAMNLKSITMKGVPCEKPADRDLLIEFVGDSITAGYGNLGMNGIESPGHAKNSDATSTYAFLTAKNLNADITATCRSGQMFSGEKPPFSDFYNQINWIRDNTPYTPTRHPDIVVINLGTGYGDRSTLADYTVKALETIKAVHPDAKIVWAYGLMGSSIASEIKTGIENFGGEAKGVYYCQLETDYSGGGGHPSLAGHKKAGETLANFIKDKGLV